ncbi:hypothetical protein [Pelagicoccus sp. SDUM812003]|uniref:hypothetical protein n=1 Tax=Pelagicoccus sp. SDUM812003 TaxID=3041267 RepID=UPI00280F17EF|nr:hypothetical protein [Pelagicoccus sp. SDUM812003]MDQ8202351.1 hypothetical protein [Pelagicoccus sp. SDUM812003]
MRLLLSSSLVALCVFLSACGGERDSLDGSPLSGISMEMADGWYAEETAGDDRWSWAQRQAEILFRNETEETRRVAFLGSLRSINPRRISASLSGRLVAEFELVADQWILAGLEVTLPPGETRLRLQSEAAAPRIAGESRELHFCLRNGRLATLEDLMMAEHEPSFASGWYDEERDRSGAWRWAQGEAVVVLKNPSEKAEPMTLRFMARALAPRELSLKTGDELLGKVALDGSSWSDMEVGIELPPGESQVTFSTDESPVRPDGDSRDLDFCLSNFSLLPSELAKGEE